MTSPLLAWQDDCTNIHWADSFTQAKWLHMHSLVYIDSYFSWMLPLDLPSLIFSILMFHVGLTIHLHVHNVYKMCPLGHVSIGVMRGTHIFLNYV